MTSPLYKSPIPLNYLDTDTALTANSDVKVPTQKAVKAYADTKAPALGADDNYVTDAEKTKLSNLSGVNTGDQTVPVKASGAEILTGTDDAKFATPKAISDAGLLDGSAGAIQDSDHAGTSSTSSSTLANITGADVSVVTTVTSHIVLLGIVQAYANLGALTGSVDYSVQLHDGTSTIGGLIGVSLNIGNTRVIIPVVHVVPSVSAGTHTYTIQHKSNNNSTSCTAEAINFIAIAIPA